jgi:inosine/xanthosine triphosphatase
VNGCPVSIAAGTTNPAKLRAIERAARDLLGSVTIEPVEVDSGVPDQPWGDEQTARGALTRAQQARERLDADYGIGVESGLVEGPGGRVYVVSWSAAIDRDGKVGFGASERFPVPNGLESRLRQGSELGPLLDELLGQPGLARREGAVSIFTQGRRDRTEILSIAVLHALVDLLQPWRPSE